MKPDELVSHHDVIAWHRDWYAGTEFVGQPRSGLLNRGPEDLGCTGLG